MCVSGLFVYVFVGGAPSDRAEPQLICRRVLLRSRVSAANLSLRSVRLAMKRRSSRRELLAKPSSVDEALQLHMGCRIGRGSPRLRVGLAASQHGRNTPTPSLSQLFLVLWVFALLCLRSRGPPGGPRRPRESPRIALGGLPRPPDAPVPGSKNIKINISCRARLSGPAYGCIPRARCNAFRRDVLRRTSAARQP